MTDRAFTHADWVALQCHLAAERDDWDIEAEFTALAVEHGDLYRRYDALADAHKALTARLAWLERFNRNACDDLAAVTAERNHLRWAVQRSEAGEVELEDRLLTARRWGWGLAGALFAAVAWSGLGFGWVALGALVGGVLGVALGIASEE